MDGRVRVVKGRLAGRAALALVACCAFVALAGCAAGETSGLGEGPGATSDGAALREGAARLPFAIEGVASDAPVVEVADAAKEASLEGVWSFGGDYADIGSFPLDGDTVFGSHSDDADDVASYGAALVGKDGAEMLEQPSDDPLRYYEPQDGSGDAELAVWRSSLVGDTAQAFADDWRLQAWDAETGEVRTLGAARDVDAHATFQAYGDVVPTTNGEDVYFSTAMQDGDVWKAVVLSCGLSGSGIGVVAEGGYPAAVDGGALFATGLAAGGDPVGFSEVALLGEAGETTLLSVSSEDSSWRVSGVWACGDGRAVAFSSDDAAAGSYIGVWDDAFATPLAWLHVQAPTVVASMNEDWLVWGSGSQSEHAEMYAFDLDGGRLALLGATPGYSRPASAQGSNAVMLPVFNGASAPVRFEVGMLPS